VGVREQQGRCAIAEPDAHQQQRKNHDEPERHGARKQHRRAEHHTRQNMRRRPQQRGQHVHRIKAHGRHAEHAGDDRHDCPQRSDKAREHHALCAMLAEKAVTGFEHFRMTGKRPQFDDAALVAAAEPETEPVAGDGARYCPREHPAEAQRAGAGERTREEHRGAAGNERAYNGDRLEKGREEHDREHPFRMTGKQMQKVEVGLLHRARRAVLA